MSVFAPIDLTALPAPKVVEQLDYEVILAERKAYAVSLWPEAERTDIANRLALESEPLTKLLQESAYRELLLRQRINEGALAVMLAFATGSDLDQIAARYSVQRLLVSAGDPEATPPIPAQYESDERLRRRTQLSLEGHSTAGPVGSYEFHSLSASALVKGVRVYSTVPGVVRITVLSTEADGSPPTELLSTVGQALNDEDVRPLCDTVEVEAAIITTYNVTATLTFYSGPGQAETLAAAQAAVQAYSTEHHQLGHDITRSGLFAALHQPGVQNVVLHTPAADIVVAASTAAYCTAITLNPGGIDE